MADEDIFQRAAEVALERGEQVAIVVAERDVTPPTDWPGLRAGQKVLNESQVRAGLERYINDTEGE